MHQVCQSVRCHSKALEASHAALDTSRVALDVNRPVLVHVCGVIAQP